MAAFRRHTFPPLLSSFTGTLGAAALFFFLSRHGSGELLLPLARLLADPQMPLGEIRSR